MSGFSVDNNTSTNFFSNMMGTNKSSSSSSGIGGWNLSDYSMIRSGAYKKLMSAYYETHDKDGNEIANKKTQELNNEDSLALSGVKSGASALQESLDGLKKSSLYEKKDMETKSEDGTTSKKSEYDWDAITKNVSNFVDSYNSFIEDAADSDNNSILKRATNLVKYAKANKDVLEDLGISIGKDNKLTLDSAALKKAEISDIKSAFTGMNSFGSQVASSAKQMSNIAASVLAKNSGAAYTRFGDYGTSITGSNYDTKVE